MRKFIVNDNYVWCCVRVCVRTMSDWHNATNCNTELINDNELCQSYEQRGVRRLQKV